MPNLQVKDANSTTQTIGSLPASTVVLTSGALTLTDTAEHQAMAAPGAGQYLYVTDIDCFNSGLTSTTIVLQNGSGGAVIWEGYVPAGGGLAKSFATPIGGVNAMGANTALYVEAGSATTSLIVNIQGFKAAS